MLTKGLENDWLQLKKQAYDTLTAESPTPFHSQTSAARQDCENYIPILYVQEYPGLYNLM